MSKILLTSDFHVKKGITTNIILDYLDYLMLYCKENDIKKIFILGDIFDKSSNIKNEAFVPLFMKLYELKSSSLELIFELGNHDIYNVNNDSVVETFKPLGRVIKEPFEDKINNHYFLPYTKKEEDIPVDKFNGVLFTHIPIANFSFDNAYHATEKHAFRTELFSDFDLVFSGHFHRHQNTGNIVYLGSPIQLNFGEAGHKKGFVVLETSNNSWEFVEYTKAPQFVVIDINDFNDFDPTNKFVSVKIDKKIENFIKLRKILLDKGAIEVTPYFKKISEDDISLNKDVSFKENASIRDVTRDYISKISKENIDTNKLLQQFDNILKEVD